MIRTGVIALLIVLALSERFRFTPRKKPLGRWVAIAAAAGYALEIASSMKGSRST